MKYENYVETRRRYGKVASFAVFDRDGRGGDGLLRVNSREEFEKNGLDHLLTPEHFGRPTVMYALNFSSANDGKGATNEDFAAFHMTHNDSKLGALVNNMPGLRGAYITDLFKDYPESSSAEVMKKFRAGEINFSKQDIIDELQTVGINPDKANHIVLGKSAEEVWNSDPIGRYNFINHYSAQGKLGNKDNYVQSNIDLLEHVGIYGVPNSDNR